MTKRMRDPMVRQTAPGHGAAPAVADPDHVPCLHLPGAIISLQETVTSLTAACLNAGTGIRGVEHQVPDYGGWVVPYQSLVLAMEALERARKELEQVSERLTDASNAIRVTPDYATEYRNAYGMELTT